MKKIISMVLCCILLFSLCACSHAITEGEVYDKEYRPAYSTVMIMPMIVSNGKTTTTYMIPYMVYYPDRYVIHIKAFLNEEWVTEDFYVSEDVYNAVNIGDMFVYDEDRGDLKDEPYTKERQV